MCQLQHIQFLLHAFPPKTTVHNSKPSVSTSGPAMFQMLSSVQGATLKKRNVVALPKEIDEAAHKEAVVNPAALQVTTG
ncbi:unnamed protein product [Tilletia laevis]|uniref:Uncharacterized protein n=3 Tax=Tilletia TaxID=13289 RepID=A0A8X7SV05_9BASI|nr:hypothetical protein CF336_g7466 [Tilletia laevis]KAE8191252.1 hypothetical protein CF328_g5737 [Tilletia controversa]KAE8248304.1 hypothetical protein A4X03_0g6816 [Tilletia caries]KAE8188347.1 hypothetical protein CF335_g6922 [Tilletia laevis]KAE8243038.1 hypothetical protein A4X06_0g6592 [Tilletia controversa]